MSVKVFLSNSVKRWKTRPVHKLTTKKAIVAYISKYQVRLQTESQNTKLLKIQQQQRQVQTQYLTQKKKMEQTFAKLTLQQQKFLKKQAQTTKQFEDQKEQIFANDRKKDLYNKQKQELQKRNEQRRQEIKQKQQKLRIKKLHLEDIRANIRKYTVYEEFLKDVRMLSDDFGPSDTDQFSVMSILERYRTMEKKKIELAQGHKRIRLEKQTRNSHILDLRRRRQQKNYEFDIKIKDLKEKIDSYHEMNLQLQSQLQGQLNENGQKQREFGQVIFSIRGLYLSIVGEQKQTNKTILEMLNVIKQQRQKLQQNLDLFHQKLGDSKTLNKQNPL